MILGLAIAAVLASAGSASKPTWLLKSAGGKKYTVTFTQPAAKKGANAIAVQDDKQKGDPVTSMKATGWDCSPFAGYGSYYCYGTALAVGQAVTFAVTLKAALAASVGWKVDWSPDQFATNNYSDLKGVGAAGPSQSYVASAIDDVARALSLEDDALNTKNAREKGAHLEKSSTELANARSELRDHKSGSAAVQDAFTALSTAEALDDAARREAGDLKFESADKKVEQAVRLKEQALADLRPLR